MNHLKVRSVLIDGEVVCCAERGLARFDVLRRRRNEAAAFLYAFDLLELNGTDLRREPIEVRKATLASILRKSRPGVRLTWSTRRAPLCSSTPARWGWSGSFRSGWDRTIAVGAPPPRGTPQISHRRQDQTERP